ncbi:hypothetical protein F2Q69_00023025 [Brassica cretica]|uniref:Uncharacterized protein n=1 Tax=Brassica cretica TaxID=69181 RepID=A0A8S9QD84_BRACR|nr:hypothetical protein F2Q69_00023025 [Brassica cretica]
MMGDDSGATGLLSKCSPLLLPFSFQLCWVGVSQVVSEPDQLVTTRPVGVLLMGEDPGSQLCKAPTVTPRMTSCHRLICVSIGNNSSCGSVVKECGLGFE